VINAILQRIEPLIPPPKPRRRRNPGRKPISDRRALTGILFVLTTRITWEDLPAEMGCGPTCWRRLQPWARAGVWPKLHAVLVAKPDGAEPAVYRSVVAASLANLCS
jgi:transposase